MKKYFYSFIIVFASLAPSNAQNTFPSSGNAGIGTTSPQFNLHISQASEPVLMLENTTDGYASMNLKSNGKLWNFSKRPGGESDVFSLYFHNGTSWLGPYLTVTSAGNIGMGTANPQGKLAVNGYIYSKKVIVTQSGWSDYVFYPAYRLRPLPEVEKYIQLQQHLPDVPSAADIEKDGIDLGDSQATLLRKIEELTLYVIAQDKKLKLLEKEMRQLKSTK